MTTLDSKSLTIGDWVLHNGKLKRVDVVWGPKVSLYDPEKTYGSIYADKYPIEEIEPIPLTAEILEKNNFEKHFDDDIIIYTHPQGIIIEMGINYKLFDDEHFFVRGIQHRLYYVHELQHALHLCGIEKEIVI